MKALLSALTGLALGLSTAPRPHAEEAPSPRRWSASPDNRYLLTFSGHHETAADAFAIQDSRGKTLFSSHDWPALKDVLSFDSSHALWSPDGEVVAVPAGSPHLWQTFLFARQGDTFVPIVVPPLTGQLDNPWVLPAKWSQGHTLLVKISGPYAGKADGYSYQGEAKLKVTLHPPACEKIFARIK